MSSERDRAAAGMASAQSRLNEQLGQMALPALGGYITQILGDFGPDGTSKMVTEKFDKAREQMGEDYKQQQWVSKEALNQQARQSGQVYGPAVVDSAVQQGAYQLQGDYQTALRNLQFSEAQANMQQYNTLTGLLGSGANTALRLGGQFSGSQAGAIGGMNGQNPWMGAVGGAASGASIGAGAGGGWYGALAGAVVGGVAGYYGSGG